MIDKKFNALKKKSMDNVANRNQLRDSLDNKPNRQELKDDE